MHLLRITFLLSVFIIGASCTRQEQSTANLSGAERALCKSLTAHDAPAVVGHFEGEALIQYADGIKIENRKFIVGYANDIFQTLSYRNIRVRKYQYVEDPATSELNKGYVIDTLSLPQHPIPHYFCHEDVDSSTDDISCESRYGSDNLPWKEIHSNQCLAGEPARIEAIQVIGIVGTGTYDVTSVIRSVAFDPSCLKSGSASSEVNPATVTRIETYARGKALTLQGHFSKPCPN